MFTDVDPDAILIALFYFFPGAIELRQQSFLWATDLAYTILSPPYPLPFRFTVIMSAYSVC